MREVEQLVGRQRPAVDAVLQRLALEQLHRDEGPAAVVADFVDGADVRVVQRRGGARFALESRQRLRVARPLVGQELQGHRPVQARVLGPVDDAHAATAELLQMR